MEGCGVVPAMGVAAEQRRAAWKVSAEWFDQPTASLMHFFSKLVFAAPESFFSFDAA